MGSEMCIRDRAKRLQPIGDAVLAVDAAALQEANRLGERGIDRHAAGGAHQFRVAGRGAHALALEVPRGLDRSGAGQQVGRAGPAAEWDNIVPTELLKAGWATLVHHLQRRGRGRHHVVMAEDHSGIYLSLIHI